MRTQPLRVHVHVKSCLKLTRQQKLPSFLGENLFSLKLMDGMYQERVKAASRILFQPNGNIYLLQPFGTLYSMLFYTLNIMSKITSKGVPRNNVNINYSQKVWAIGCRNGISKHTYNIHW